MTTLETIQEILNENLDIDPATVAADSTFESLGIDSLDMVELVCEIENRFDIELGEARRPRYRLASWSTTSTA